MKRAKSAKKRRIEILVCGVLLAGMAVLGMKANQYYISPEKAFWAAERLYGYGPSERILWEKEDGDTYCYIGILPQAEKDSNQAFFEALDTDRVYWDGTYIEKPAESIDERSLSFVELKKGLFWKIDFAHCYPYAGNMVQTWHKENMSLIAGFCWEPEIVEIALTWGNWLDGAENRREPYIMGKGICSVDQDGFFCQEIDESKAYAEGDYTYAVNILYMEGYDEEGNLVYRHGLDENGVKWNGFYKNGLEQRD